MARPGLFGQLSPFGLHQAVLDLPLCGLEDGMIEAKSVIFRDPSKTPRRAAVRVEHWSSLEQPRAMGGSKNWIHLGAL